MSSLAALRADLAANRARLAQYDVRPRTADSNPALAVQLAAAGITVPAGLPAAVQVSWIARDLVRREREAREGLTAAIGKIGPGEVVPDPDLWRSKLLALARAQAREAVWGQLISPYLAPAQIEVAVIGDRAFVSAKVDDRLVAEATVALPAGPVPVAAALGAESRLLAAVREAAAALVDTAGVSR